MSWSVELVEQIVTGQARNFPVKRIDDLIAWTIDRDTPATRLISTAFSERSVSRDDGEQFSLAIMDQLFFTNARTPWETLGLTPGTDEKHVRIRYRRLLGIFHPDRQLGSAEWCHERTDQINQAFRQIQAGEGDAATVALVPAGTAGEKRRRHKPPKPQIETAHTGHGIGDALRQWIGGSQSFQTRFFSLLIAGASVVLLLFYFAGMEPEDTAVDLALDKPLSNPEPEPKSERTGFIESRESLATIDREVELLAPPRLVNEPSGLALETVSSEPTLSEPPPSGKSGQDHFSSAIKPQPLVEAAVQEQRQPAAEIKVSPTPRLVEAAPTQPPPSASPVLETAPVESLSPTTRAILAEKAPILPPAPPDVCAGTEIFLADFTRHYEAGDLDRYLRLYTEEAIENKAHGKAAILAIYEPFFDSTSHRLIDLTVTSSDSSSQDLCILAADFNAHYFNQSGQQMAVSAQIQFQLMPAENGGVLISRMQY